MGLKKSGGAEPLREVVEREHARDSAGLAVQLREGDAEQRRWAARDLAGRPDAAALMGERLLAEQDPRVREALLTSLTATPGEAAVSALLPLLRSEDAQLRNGAIEALAAMPQAVGPRIGALLRDADPDVRIFTVNLLGELRHDQVVTWLMQVLQHDGGVNVVAAAIEVLAEVGAPEHVAPLRAATQRFASDPFIAFAADLAAQRIQAA
jgi:HEAT repeat protein